MDDNSLWIAASAPANPENSGKHGPLATLVEPAYLLARLLALPPLLCQRMGECVEGRSTRVGVGGEGYGGTYLILFGRWLACKTARVTARRSPRILRGQGGLIGRGRPMSRLVCFFS